MFYYIILVTVADANSNFIAIDVGTYRSNSDASVFQILTLLKTLNKPTGFTTMFSNTK